MQSLLFLSCVIFSLPGLVAILVLASLQHVIVTRNPLKIAYDLVISTAWGLPILALSLIALIITNFISTARPLGALVIAILNLVAVTLVVLRVGWPRLSTQGIFFLPSLLAIAGSVWIASASPLVRAVLNRLR